MRPTGRLHIGHYFGALQNWIQLQNDPQYECFFFIADWHALTTHYAEDTRSVPQNTLEITTDWLAVGLDSEKSILFVQSLVPEHAELHLLLSMITPLSWLERVPTYKEQIENLQDKDLGTYGFLGYPLLQSADIVMYDADLVPVGEDQVPHVELTREIVRRFNHHFGLNVLEDLNTRESLEARKEINQILHTGAFHPGTVMPEFAWENWTAELLKVIRTVGFDNVMEELPQPLRRFFRLEKALVEPGHLLTETPRLPGTDGRRMAKSYGNAIWLNDSDAEIRSKTRTMMTDPARKRRTDPGDPAKCPAFDWHKLFSPPDVISWADQNCRTAGIGCIECKGAMAEHLIRWIAPIRERREEYAAHPDKVLRILDEGSAKARVVAQKTMVRVREAVFHWDDKRKEVAAPRVMGKAD